VLQSRANLRKGDIYMGDKKNKNSKSVNQNNADSEFYNDQLGENAGEGRMAKKQDQKKNCHRGI